ncbi:hypothetical protein ABEF93_007442 [Exophiala dermatitidis]
MCWYKLDVCPYPHREPISALIFDPSNASQWEYCDKPQPWGRLSCGNLIVEHSKDSLKSEVSATFEHILASRSNLPVDVENQPLNAHPVRRQRSSTEGTIVPSGAGNLRPRGAQCLWCGAVLKMVATKSKEVHEIARRQIASLEQKMDTSFDLRELQREIMDQEKMLDDLRHSAWLKAREVMEAKGDDDNGQTEVQG